MRKYKLALHEKSQNEKTEFIQIEVTTILIDIMEAVCDDRDILIGNFINETIQNFLIEIENKLKEKNHD